MTQPHTAVACADGWPVVTCRKRCRWRFRLRGLTGRRTSSADPVIGGDPDRALAKTTRPARLELGDVRSRDRSASSARDQSRPILEYAAGTLAYEDRHRQLHRHCPHWLVVNTTNRPGGQRFNMQQAVRGEDRMFCGEATGKPNLSATTGRQYDCASACSMTGERTAACVLVISGSHAFLFHPEAWNGDRPVPVSTGDALLRLLGVNVKGLPTRTRHA